MGWAFVSSRFAGCNRSLTLAHHAFFIFAGSLESANSSILAFLRGGGEKSGFYVNGAG